MLFNIIIACSYIKYPPYIFIILTLQAG